MFVSAPILFNSVVSVLMLFHCTCTFYSHAYQKVHHCEIIPVSEFNLQVSEMVNPLRVKSLSWLFSVYCCCVTVAHVMYVTALLLHKFVDNVCVWLLYIIIYIKYC